MKAQTQVTILIDEIIPYEKNNKLHSPEQIDVIRKSISDYGVVQDIVIDQNNEVVIGHGRLQAIKQLRDMGAFPKEIKVTKLEGYTKSEIRKLRIIDNKTNEMTGWDIGNLKIELEELQDIELNDLFVDLDHSETNYSGQVGTEKTYNNKEIGIDDLGEFECKCPKCGFEFNKDK